MSDVTNCTWKIERGRGIRERELEGRKEDERKDCERTDIDGGLPRNDLGRKRMQRGNVQLTEILLHQTALRHGCESAATMLRRATG